MQQSTNLYERKGQSVGGSVSAIIMLIVGIGVSVLVLLFVGALGGSTYNLIESDIDGIANNVVTEQGLTVLNETASSLGHFYVQSGTLSIGNTTDIWGLGNFTIDYVAGTAQIAAGAQITNNTAVLANYTWGDVAVRNHVKASITSGFQALEQTGNYLPIIVLAVVISLVLTLVLGFTALGGGFGGSGSAL